MSGPTPPPPAGNTIPCDHCGTPVTASEIQQGLAVRVNNKLTCPICVDQLPSDAQLKINQLRAMRGLDSTTYLVPDPRRPQTKCYTFSTTSNILRHRHHIATGSDYQPPLLPNRTRTVSHRFEAQQAAAQAVDRTRRQRLLKFWPVGLAALFLLLFLATRMGSDPTDPPSDVAVSSNDVASTTDDPDQQVRTDIRQVAENDLLAAWGQARRRLDADDPLVWELLGRLQTRKQLDLETARSALAGYALGEARHALQRTPIPDHDPRFEHLREQEQQLRQQLADLEQPRQVDRRPPEPESEPQPEPESELSQADNDRQHADEGEADETLTSQLSQEPLQVEPPSQDSPASPAIDPSSLQVWASPAEHMLRYSTLQDDCNIRSRSPMTIGQQRRTAALQRAIDLPPGRWRVWLEARCLDRQARIMGMLGDNELTASGEDLGNTYRWLQLSGEVNITPDMLEAEQTAISTDLFLSFITRDSEESWGLRRILVADARLSDPGPALTDRRSEAIPWTYVPAPAAEDPPARTLSFRFGSQVPDSDHYEVIDIWNPQLPGRLLPRIVEQLQVSVGQYIATAEGDGRSFNEDQFIRHSFANPVDASQNGLSVYIHSNRIDGRRSSIDFVLVDSEGRPSGRQTVPLPDGDQWQRLWVPIADSWIEQAQRINDSEDPRIRRRAVFDPRSVSQINVIDSITWPFLLAEIAVHPSRQVEENPEHLLPRSLIRPRLPRANELRDRNIDPNAVRVLAGTDQQFNATWRTGMREALAAILPVRELPRGAVANLHLYDPALDREFIYEHMRRELVQHSVLLVMTAGMEFPRGLNRQQALHNFWEKMLVEAQRSNFLPVVVLGPTKVVDQHRENSDLLWEELLHMLDRDRRFAGIPVIDLRSIEAIDYNRFATGHRQRSIDLLTQAYEEIRYRIQHQLR